MGEVNLAHVWVWFIASFTVDSIFKKILARFLFRYSRWGKIGQNSIDAMLNLPKKSYLFLT